MDSGRSNGPISSSGPAPVLSANDGNEVMKQLRRTHKKVETMEEALQNRLSVVANEVSDLSNNFVIEAARLFGNSFKVKIVGEKYETRSERLESLQLTTMENLGKAQAGDAEKLRAASVNLVATEGKWRQFFNDAQNLVNQFGTGVNRISEHVNLHLSVIEDKSKC